MARALELARRGLFGADPNPAVGCVLTRGDEVVGEGWHARAGELHAEAHALAAAGARARGATAYVTLEPCSHHGRTPPCAAALVEAGVRRTVFAVRDPHPRVDGAGSACLRAAGIEVDEGLLAGPAEALIRGFLSRHRRGRPFVVSKLAVSIDGRTALGNGASRWITGPAAREDGHRLRARASAILTGIGTVLADDPSLDVRLPDSAGAWRQPRRVVLDSALRLPATARLAAGPGETLVFTGERCSSAAPARVTVERIGTAGDGLDLHAVLARLAGLEVNELLVEAGPRLNGSLLRAALVDEWVVYVAPLVLGDKARGMFELPALERMAERIPVEAVELRRIGDDWRFTLRPGRTASACSPAS